MTARFQYDCGNCKFNWCCGRLCACALRNLPVVPSVQRHVDAEQREWRKAQGDLTPEELREQIRDAMSEISFD